MIRFCKICGVHLCDRCRDRYTMRMIEAFKAALLGKRADSPGRCYTCGRTEAQLNQRGENAG